MFYAILFILMPYEYLPRKAIIYQITNMAAAVWILARGNSIFNLKLFIIIYSFLGNFILLIQRPLPLQSHAPKLGEQIVVSEDKTSSTTKGKKKIVFVDLSVVITCFKSSHSCAASELRKIT